MSRSDLPPTEPTVPSVDDPVLQPDPELESVLRELLGPPPVELADDVMAALGLSDELGPALREALAAPPVELADDVMAALGLSVELGPALREALAAPPVAGAGAPMALADDVMAALGLSDELGPALREALAAPPVAGAGAPMALAGDVMAALGLGDGEAVDFESGDGEAGGELIAFPAPAPAASPGPAAPAPLPAVTHVRRSARPVWLGGLALAAAALLAVVVGTRRDAGEDFQMAENNQVAIEELEGGEQVLVQVFQMDENAPTIIFIDELSEDAGGISL